MANRNIYFNERVQDMSTLNRHTSHPAVKSGDLYFNANNYLESINYYDKALQMGEDNLEALMGKGFALREIGKFLDAIQCFDEYIKYSKELHQKIDGFLYKGYTYISTGAYMEASESFDKCIEIDRKATVGAYIGLGLVNDYLGAYHEAIRFYNKALGGRKDKHFAFIYTNKGNVFHRLGRDYEAIDSYSTALSFDKNELGALIGKMVYYNKCGRYNEANEYYKQALNVDPNFVVLSHISRGISLHLDSKYDEVLQEYDKAIEVSSKYEVALQYASLIYINKGLFLYSIDKYNEAIDCFNEALKKDTTYSILSWIGIGASQEKLSNSKLAIEYYNKATDSDPNLEMASLNNILYINNERGYEEGYFCEAFNNRLLNKIIRRMRMRLSSPVMDLDFEDIALGGYHEKEMTREHLQEIKGTTLEVGIAGEEIINAYFRSLCKDGKIKWCKWISKYNANSPYDFWIENCDNEKINIDVKSTRGEFDRLIHISYGELKIMCHGDRRYDIYRVYKLNDDNAKLRIASDMRSFASIVLEKFETLPAGVTSDSISVDTSILKFGLEVVIHK